MPEMSLVKIAEDQNRKAHAFIERKAPGSFIYAYFPGSGKPEGIIRAHEAGFNNYPTAKVRNPKGLYFFEQLMGCGLHSSSPDNQNTFNTWCEPVIGGPGEIEKISLDMSGSEIWLSYEKSLLDYLEITPEDLRLPLNSLSWCPLDTACALCGAENLFMWMYEYEEAVDDLLNRVVDAHLAVFNAIKNLGFKQVNLYGFPCLYANDLLAVNLSPQMIERFLLPCYEKAARAWGGILLILNCPDTDLAGKVIEQDYVIGAGLDSKIPLSEINGMIGGKLFMMNHYLHDPAYDKPTFVDGMWVNAIGGVSIEYLQEACRELAGKNLLITIERRTLEEVIEIRKFIENLRA